MMLFDLGGGAGAEAGDDSGGGGADSEEDALDAANDAATPAASEEAANKPGRRPRRERADSMLAVDRPKCHIVHASAPQPSDDVVRAHIVLNRPKPTGRAFEWGTES